MAGPDIIPSRKAQMPYYHRRAHEVLASAKQSAARALDAPISSVGVERYRALMDTHKSLLDLEYILCAITGNGYEPETCTQGQPNPTISEKNCKHVLEVSDES